jgi:uncharacterized YccA/Bax inhibitor family protein
MAFRTSNPTLKDDVFREEVYYANNNTMTIQGTVNKTLILTLLVFASAFLVWNKVFIYERSTIYALLLGATIATGILGIIIVFQKGLSPYLAPVYAVLEGISLGIISAVFEAQFSGIVFQAVTLTFCTLIALLLVYKSRLIAVTQNFILGVSSITVAIALIYLLDIILSFFGMNVPLIHETGILGIFLAPL